MGPLELRNRLEGIGAVYGTHFTFGGLGPKTPGIETIGGAYYTYLAEYDGSSYRKTSYTRHASQEEALTALEAAAHKAMQSEGIWVGA